MKKKRKRKEDGVCDERKESLVSNRDRKKKAQQNLQDLDEII